MISLSYDSWYSATKTIPMHEIKIEILITVNNAYHSFSSCQLLFLSYIGVLCPGFLGSGVDGVRVGYAITWFCSWSPCSNCARRLSRFMSQMPNLRLRIFVSRLYFCDNEDSLEREGLRCLQKAGVQVTVMTYKGKNRKIKSIFWCQLSLMLCQWPPLNT